MSDLALHITPLQNVQSGTVTAIPTLSPYVDITWDGSTTNIVIGQMVKITDGTTLKTYGVIRKAPSGSTLYISATPLGSAGVATRIENVVAVNDTVTVYNHMPIWNVFSRIADGVFYKSWDIPYVAQNSTPPPVCNTGAWQVASLASGVSTHTFTLPRNGVNTSFALGSATITSYLWTLPAGVTFATGFSSTDDVIDVVAVAGTYQVSCLLTDSNGETHTAYLWLFVSDGTTGTSLSERYVMGDTITDNTTRKGREITFTIIGDDLQDVIYPSAGIVLKDWSVFGGESLSDDVPIDTFIGYISHDGLSFTHDGNVGKATVKAVSPFLYAEKVGQPLQALEEVTTPTHWAQCTSALSNPRGYLYYAMKWHAPNIINMHDFDADHATPRRQFAEFNTNSLAAAMQVSALYIAGNIGSASDGTTVLKLNPMLMSNTDRNALDVVITWLEEDISPQFAYDKRFGGGFSESRIGGFASDGTTTKAWLAGKRWHQGASVITSPNISVTIAEGVDRIKEASGHILAEANADIQGITIELNGLQDVIDPVYMLWNRLTVSSEFDPNGVGFANERMLPSQVSRTWELTNNGWMKRLALTLQPETFGQAGEEIPIGSAANWLLNGMSAALPVQHAPLQGDNALNGVGMMIVNDDNGKFAICYDTTAVSLNYTDLSASVDNETVNDWTIDWNSNYFNNGNDITQAIGVYAITTTSTTLNVWYFADILNNTLATIIQTYTMADSSNTSEARIECSETTPTYCAVAWHDQTGTEFGYSSDGGSTWQAKANVGSTVSDTANDNAPLAMDIDGTVTIISAPDATPEYGMYKAATVGGAFSEITNTERTSAPQPMAKIEPDGTKGYISSPASGTITLADITFDVGGSSYTLGALNHANSTVQTGGNPDNCLRRPDHNNATYMWADYAAGTSIEIADIVLDVWSVRPDKCRLIAISTTERSRVDFLSDAGIVASTWGSVSMATETPADFPFTTNAIELGVAIWGDGFVGGGYDTRMDNIVITTGGGTVLELYSVDPLTGAAVWTDITPATDEAPERPHDLSIGLIDNQVIDTVSGTSNNWYSSLDGGTSFSTSESASDKRAFLTAGETLLSGGNGEVALSIDSGTSFEDITGNLASVWGSTVGIIKRIYAL